MKYSSRISGELHPNALAQLLERKRSSRSRFLDLTESNPTRAGIQYPTGFLAELAREDAARYEPEPFGMPAARETIAREYGTRADRVILSASTSEAYSWLFKLLCNPGDEVLVPQPSYPLFEHLAALENVAVRRYGLFYDHGWFIDLHTIKTALSDRTRAIVLVNPNNPTGHFLRRGELEALGEFGLPLISDEVFRDYVIAAAEDSLISLDGAELPSGIPLLFTLNGLSKAVGLPQMKLAWTLVKGVEAEVRSALARLEIIADTYLSVGTPVQYALPSLLALRGPVQRQIRERTRANLDFLRASGLRVFDVEAGWYAIASVGEDLSLRLLEECDVLVQPGYFYDFEQSGLLVLSLLTPPEVFREGVQRVRSLLPSMAR